MHFFKRNFKTILLDILIIGTIGTLISYFLIGDTYDYEEYYSLSDPLTTTQVDELSIQLNQDINSQFDGQPATIKYSTESQYLSLNVKSMVQGDISTVKTQFDEMLDNMGLQYEEGVDITIHTEPNIVPKLIIIGIFLLLGVILGLLQSMMNKRIETDEDVEYYLNEKTLGTF